MTVLNKICFKSRPKAIIKIIKLSTALLPLAFLLTNAYAAPGDMIIPRKGSMDSLNFTPASRFPHWVHRLRFRCDACHDSLFKMKLGETEISMELMKKNQVCGACHNNTNRIAFAITFGSCDRCHADSTE